MQLRQNAWADWAKKRHESAAKAAMIFEKQAKQVQALLLERGCLTCDPLIELEDGELGGPRPNVVSVQHDLFCPNDG